MKYLLLLLLLISDWANLQKHNPEHQKALDSFVIMDGFQIELIAAEPLIHDPVAMEIDEEGNWYVVEMPGYPLDLSKTGTIKKLKDTNGDGQPDKSIIFADGLTLPMGLMKWKNGLIVADSPNILYLEDTNGDEIADKKEIILTGFSLSNPQHNMNSPKFGIDNWIYVGHSGAINSFAYEKVFSDKGSPIRFPESLIAKKLNKNADGKNVRFKPDNFEVESLSGETQFGHTTNAWGHRFYTDNANHLFHEVLDARYIALNPNLAISEAMQKIPDHGDACEVFPITENPNHQLLTDVGIVTSSCGITYYDGGAFGEKFNNVTFIGEPVHNLVHADIIQQKGATFKGKRLIEKAEFLASKDPWFRPVNFYTGPDGALYIIDYYRQIVEHPEWLSDETNKSGALYNGTDKGRIYRVTKKGSPKINEIEKVNLANKTPAELVEILKSENGWKRRTAQRLLFQKNDTTISHNLQELIESSTINGKIAALWLLYDWQKMNPEILAKALTDEIAGVRENALQIADRLFQSAEYQNNSKLKAILYALANDNDPRVRFQWLCSSAFFKFPETSSLQANILIKDFADNWTGMAAIAASYKGEMALLEKFVSKIPKNQEQIAQEFVENLAATIAKSGDKSIFTKAIYGQNWWSKAIMNGLATLWKYNKPKFEITENERIKLLELYENTAEDDNQKAIINLITAIGLPKNLGLLNGQIARFDKIKTLTDQTNTLKLLSLSGREIDNKKIVNTLLNSKYTSLQQAALNALPQNLEPAIIASINKKYKTFDLNAKKTWVNYLTSRYDRCIVLLSEIEKGNIAQNDLEWAQKVGLMNYYNNRIRLKARQLLSINEDRKAILQKYLTASDMPGDSEKGRKIFADNCSQCHKIKGADGIEFGPDLSTLKSRNPHSIITEIINPNNSIADKYGSWDLVLKNGDKISGIIISENEKSLFLKMIGGKTQEISVSKIETKNISKISAMPNGFENAITVENMADLVSFIKNI